jgi:hypothetical protein
VHTYASAGDHQIRVSGTFPNIYFNNAGDKLKVKSVENKGLTGWLSLISAFRGCSNMTSFVAGNTDTSNVSDMFAMLGDNVALVTADMRGFDTSSSRNMNGMFINDSNLTTILGVEDFNIEALDATTDLNNFMNGVTMSTARYDALLINWDAQNPFNGMSPNFGGSTYTGGGVAAAARANLISTDGWTITDGGIA